MVINGQKQSCFWGHALVNTTSNATWSDSTVIYCWVHGEIARIMSSSHLNTPVFKIFKVSSRNQMKSNFMSFYHSQMHTSLMVSHKPDWPTYFDVDCKPSETSEALGCHGWHSHGPHWAPRRIGPTEIAAEDSPAALTLAELFGFNILWTELFTSCQQTLRRHGHLIVDTVLIAMNTVLTAMNHGLARWMMLINIWFVGYYML